MGCFGSKDRNDNATARQEEPKVYSWDRRERVDPKDYTLQNLTGETVGRLPGEVKGQQFIIDRCKDCNIYIFDHSATITVDDCVNCRIFLGPIQGSVFIRDCTDCQIALACQQFRTRDCKKIDIFLHCVTQPIIEATTAIRFGCFQYYYKELKDQFAAAKLSVFSNNWSNIHDFTPVAGENNWMLIPENARVDDYLPLPSSEKFANMNISTTMDDSVVPITTGCRRKLSQNSCLVAFFADAVAGNAPMQYVKKLQKETNCSVVQTKQLSMRPDDSMRVFYTERYNDEVLKGDVIGMEVNGDNVLDLSKQLLENCCRDYLYYLSDSASAGNQDIDAFFNFNDVGMGGL